MGTDDPKIKEENGSESCIKCGAPLRYPFEIESGICEDCMIKLLKDP